VTTLVDDGGSSRRGGRSAQSPYASEAFLHQILGKALGAGASDVHLKAGQPPGARVRGDLVFFRVDKIRPEDTEAATGFLLAAAGKEDPVEHEVAFAYEAPGVGRFRVSAFRQRGAISLVMRSIPARIPTPAELGLPPAATALVEQPRGLVVVAGGARSGRSTTAAALLGHLNENYPRHIITFEDPIEHVHADARASVAQRALGADVASLAEGLRSALRHDPDVLFAADLATPDALEAALDAADLGHLVLAVVGARDVSRAVARLLAMGRALPDTRARLASALQVVIAQRLLPKRDGSAEVVACEVLVATSALRDALRREEADLPVALRDHMEKGASPHGMATFEMAVKQLATQGMVSKAPA
jgi:twitching motility protein PilT